MKMEEKIRAKLEQVFQPTSLDVSNESHLHAGHMGDDGSGESHFSIEIASKSFDKKNRIERERAIYQALESEMKKIHALSIKII
jgi:BolA protein